LRVSTDDHHQKGAEAPFVAILVDTVFGSERLSCAMKAKSLTSFAARSYLIVLLLALGFSFVAKAQAPAEDDSPAGLRRQITELYQQGKY
jgi:hypothetical protein